jgi:glycine/D-amino acid oxidase-like deaminating enzyme
VRPPRSLWWSSLDAPVVARAPLHGRRDVDVAIVGGGFTGLWTARELLRRDPSLRVAVLEQAVCGYGASGRNGGWASALFPVPDEPLIRLVGLEAFTHQRHVLQEAVRALGASAQTDGIDAHFVRGGSLTFARNEVQAHRLRAGVEESRGVGVTEGDLEWLDGPAARERAGLTSVLGAIYTPHCARIHPARLVRGLADVVERLGAAIFEESPVTRIVAGHLERRPHVVTAAGTVHADYVVRATEGFTPTFAGQRRSVAPIYSLMVATEPLSDDFWNEAGLAGYETFADDRNLIIYGQRTNDDRIAFGGRGAPYHFGSTVEPRFDYDDRSFHLLEVTLRELFPYLDGEVTHRWGGPLAMPRDQMPSVRVDRTTGLASAGGYTGDGVVLSYVCANALADLLVAPDVETGYTRLPFVQREAKPWEPEPLRWLGINLGLGLASWADRHEERRGTESRASRLLDRLFDQFPP